jgi:hypothetical protein
VAAELEARSTEGKNGQRIVPIDSFMEYALEIWCGMAEGQRERLLALFGRHDDGDGVLSLHEFTAVVAAATPEADGQQVMDLYKACLDKTAELRGENGGTATATAQEEDEDDASMDSIKPEAFLSVVLPFMLAHLGIVK